MDKPSMLDKLKEKLSKTSKEEMQQLWDSGNHLDEGSLKVTDWLRSVGNHKLADKVKSKYTESKEE